jgi:organic radical activating enzyme
MEETVKLIECYRNTLQGEGIDVGKRMSLFRFKYCNKKCKFCDTLVKMRIQQEAEYKITDLQNILDEEKTNPMITGGEPTIERHFNDTLKLINILNYKGVANLETNGYNLLELIKKIDKSKKINISYSPKMFSKKELEEEIDRSKELKNYLNVYYKILYQDNNLIKKYLEFLEQLDINDRVWLMPEGVNRADLIRNSEKVFDACEKYRFNFSTRSHIIYGFI